MKLIKLIALFAEFEDNMINYHLVCYLDGNKVSSLFGKQDNKQLLIKKSNEFKNFEARSSSIQNHLHLSVLFGVGNCKQKGELYKGEKLRGEKLLHIERSHVQSQSYTHT